MHGVADCMHCPPVATHGLGWANRGLPAATRRLPQSKPCTFVCTHVFPISSPETAGVSNTLRAGWHT